MTALLVVFLAVAALLWLASFGYLGALALIAARRRDRPTPPGELPRIAVIITTYNEEERIDARLADLARTAYPRDRMRVVIVDGRSTDGTLAHIEAARREGAAIELLRAPEARSKLEQVRHGLAAVEEEIVVATDADAQLDPDCIRTLVTRLLADEATAIVGARVQPATDLIEERIYWWFLNTLWWLEGEALGAAMVSGVCHAMRRSVLLAAQGNRGADDVLFALAAGAQGHRVRLCRHAWAIETRVPQTAVEFVSFRRRRGAGYLGALLAPAHTAGLPGWRVARTVRLFHFLATPVLTCVLGVLGLALCWTPHWHWPLVVAALFAAPVLAALFASSTLAGLCTRRWQLGLAAASLVGLTWLSLLLTPRPSSRAT